MRSVNYVKHEDEGGKDHNNRKHSGNIAAGTHQQKVNVDKLREEEAHLTLGEQTTKET